MKTIRFKTQTIKEWELGQKTQKRRCGMLQCPECGVTYFTLETEEFENCELCGGKLENKKIKEETKEE